LGILKNKYRAVSIVYNEKVFLGKDHFSLLIFFAQWVTNEKVKTVSKYLP